jgi:hypothetical protein
MKQARYRMENRIFRLALRRILRSSPCICGSQDPEDLIQGHSANCPKRIARRALKKSKRNHKPPQTLA